MQSDDHPQVPASGAVTERIVRLEGGWTCETYQVGDRIVQLARTPYAAETLRGQLTADATLIDSGIDGVRERLL
jgi:hypothetical protein